jgi:hypothetical protein
MNPTVVVEPEHLAEVTCEVHPRLKVEGRRATEERAGEVKFVSNSSSRYWWWRGAVG